MSSIELIKELQRLVQEHGDLTVLRAENGAVLDVHGVSLLPSPDKEPVILIQ